MHRCFICDRVFSQTVTKYPDGKDPCPECVESYRSFKSHDEVIVFDDEDTERMEQLELFNLPTYVEDYYDQ